jgi:Zn-dependent protease with chaperone function
MDNILLVVVLLEYVLLVTTAAPMLLPGRFQKHPNLGIGIWYGLFASSLVATILALGLGVYSVFETYLRLREGQPMWFVLLASVAPWILLGLAGVVLAMSNLRLAPLFEVAKKADYLQLISPREVFKYRRAKVYELDLPNYFAFTKDRGIYLTKSAFELPGRQLEAILRHEYGHIKLAHQRLKAIAALGQQLFPWLAVSRALATELDRLCELAADNYALKRVYSKDLAEARSKFL